MDFPNKEMSNEAECSRPESEGTGPRPGHKGADKWQFMGNNFPFILACSGFFILNLLKFKVFFLHAPMA